MEKYSKSVICLVESIQLIRMPGFLLLLSLIVASHSLDLESYGHSAVLDGDAKYKVHWSYQGDTITFLLQVETLGYVGFGFSHKGGMTFSDIVIGGVENGKPYLQDYYTDVNRVPQRDSQQDYNLEYAKENGTHTILQFKRKLNTCDKNDKIITESTMRVIWAYHEDDVENGVLQHHGMNRGQKSLRLLNSEKTSELPLETNYFNFTNVDIPIPARDTIYWCQMFKMPTLNKKHHVIKVEPLIQKGHENLVHHILIYECMRNANDEVLSYGHECYHPNMPDVFYTCETVLYGWAIGGEGFTYPPHVGLSIGLSTDPKYVLMEIHYDNPSRKKGFIDNSGIRLYYTPHLRKYDAGVLQTGIFVNPYHMIPPGMTKFISEGHCTMECLKEALNAEKPTGIHVFAVLLHTHLTGRAIRTRHFRRGEEQKLLAYDNEFDFNFQESQYLKEERTILPGDNLITECQYNTKQRTTMTLGGLSTSDEMCLSFLMYYPRIKLAKCETSPGIREQLSFIGVKELYKPKGSSTFLIKSPQKYNNLTVTDAMNTFPWSEENGKSFNDRVRQIPIIIQCSKHEYYTWMVHGEIVSPPNVTNSYMQESFICDSSSYCLNINTFDYLFIVLCSLCSYFVLY